MASAALACILLLAVSVTVHAVSREELFTHGYGFDHHLPRDDETSSPEIPLSIPIVFYGEKYTTIFVNSNGLLSFQTEIPSFFNIQFPLNYAVIAPLYSNVDTRSSGTISYRETQDSNSILRINRDIRNHFSRGQDFEAKNVFVATWADVGYHDAKSDKLNTFQVVIATDGEDSYVEFIYPDGGIQWIQGMGADTGLPDARAQAGLISSNGTLFALTGSGTDQVQNLDRRTNMNAPGQWIFHVGRVSKIEEPDMNNEVDGAQNQHIATCAEGSSHCHSQSKCVDYRDGFCCVCNNHFYGNGKTCIKNDVPMRVNGKVSGILNGIQLEQLDLQSYIVMSDGRTYTAISKVPREIGYNVQTLQILGSLIGFLFAKPVGDVKNGYQVTGGIFNHTATVHFHDTNDRVQITQNYLGLDVFDQLRLEIILQGTVPTVPAEARFMLPNYEEEFTLERPGLLSSRLTHQYQYGEPTVVNHYSIDQTIEYKPCLFDSSPESVTWKHKVFKNFINYENTEHILRFGMSSKVTPLAEIDPCKDDRAHCGPDSTCVVEGDSFRCVCRHGYQYIHSEQGAVCVDINECQVGLHNCDQNAQCINKPGGFACRCNAGFEGDGYYCRSGRSCADIHCPEHAECVEDDEVRCTCSYGYIGDGRICVSDKRVSCDIVNNCSPYAHCRARALGAPHECHCAPGYDGNGYICERSDYPPEEPNQSTETTNDFINTTPSITDATFTQRTHTVLHCDMGECWCPDGYFKDPNSNYCIWRDEGFETESTHDTPPDVNEESCSVINNCHPNAQCIFTLAGNYQCRCNAGYEGNGYECTLIDVSCAEVYMCNLHASCIYNTTIDKSICICNQGYQGDGIFCEPIAQCRAHSDCKENEYCSVSSAENQCVCMDGYVRDAEDVCRKLVGTCGGGTCVEHAQCLDDPEDHTKYCQCDPDYVGDGITECRPRPLGCNILNNCGLHANCVYDRTDRHYQCQCDDGFYGDGFVCSSQKTCILDPYLCDAHASCVQDHDRQHVCRCDEGYTGNGTVCRISPRHEGNFLLLNQGMATLRIPFEPSPKNPGRPIQIQYYQMAIGLDIDCFGGRVYWSDITGKSLKSSVYNGTNYTDFLVDDIGSPEGLSIDWLSRNIYWTDSSKDTLEVANLDTKLRKTLFSDGLENPRGIAVHPRRGKIFWSDWDRREPKIEWANMDGTGRQIFLQGSNVQLPNSIAIDWETDEMCFADAGTKNIDCVNIDTREIRTIATNCTYPFGLTISENHFYWTDWVSQKIESVNKHTLIRQTPMGVPLGGSGNKLYGIAAVPEQCPGLMNACQFYNGQCPKEMLCLPNGLGQRACVCADGQTCHQRY